MKFLCFSISNHYISYYDLKHMKCNLCKKDINNYNSEFNNLKIDENQTVDICQSCIDTFVRWQGAKYAKLFPTTMMKKQFEKKK